MRKKLKKVIYLWEIFYFLDYFAVLAIDEDGENGQDSKCTGGGV